MMFGSDTAPRRRRPSMTPMIDVVFLLLIFFMLAARFGIDTQITVATPGGGVGLSDWQGAPRLVEVRADDVALNGRPVPLNTLPDAVNDLLPAPDAPVIIVATDDVALQRLLDVMSALRADTSAALIMGPAP